MVRTLLSLILSILCISVCAAEPPPEPTPPAEAHHTPPSDKIPPMVPELPAAAQNNTPNYEHAFLKMILTLLGLLILVFLTFWIFRKLSHGRFGSLNFNRSIKILEKRPLSAKSMLYLVELENKKILISESQLEVRSLGTIEDITTSTE